MAGAIFSSVIDLHNGTQVPKTVGVLSVRLLANLDSPAMGNPSTHKLQMAEESWRAI
jgi:hypothetical protein